MILQHLGEVIENDRTRTVTKRYFPIDIYTYEIPFTSPAKIKYYFEPAQLYTKYRTKCFHFYSPHTIKIQSSTIMFMFTIFDIIILGRVIIINQGRNDILIHRDWTPRSLNTRAIPMHNNTSTTMYRHQHFVLSLHRHCRG